jgi:hypothetical protein
MDEFLLRLLEAGEQVILGSEQTDPLSEVANLLAVPPPPLPRRS